MKKKYFVIIAVVGVILASFFVVKPKSIPPRKEAVVEKKLVKFLLEVDFDAQKASSSSQISVPLGTNALSGLQKAHDVTVKHYSFGDMVEAVDDISGGNGKYWIYYVNGKTAKVGASDYKLKEGDQILWKLEAEKN